MYKRKIQISMLVLVFISLFFGLISIVEAGKNGTVQSDGGENELIFTLKDDSRVFKMKFNTIADLHGIAAEFRENSVIDMVELNHKVSAAAFPNDPEYTKQWYLDAISARDAWSRQLLAEESLINEGKKPKEAIIAVLDTGVFLEHPDLSENIWRNKNERIDLIDNDKNGYIDDINGWDFVDDSNDPRPKFTKDYNTFGVNHGTVISGVASAIGNNSVGISGISWHSKIMPLRVLDSQGNGNVYNVLLAIDYAVKNNAHIINMSFVGDEYSQLLQDRLKNAADKGIIIVAAAGNNNPEALGLDMDNKRLYPVCLDADSKENFIIGVASIGRDFKKSIFSHYGTQCVDISAPGEAFWGLSVLHKDNKDFNVLYDGYWSGTSVAAPLISATAATIISLRPNLTRDQITSIILQSVDGIEDQNPDYLKGLGTGKLNLLKAIENTLAMGFGSPDKPEAGKISKNRIIASLGYGSFPQIKIFNPDRSLFKAFFAYAPTFKGGINVIASDINKDDIREIITSTGIGGGPHIRIFNQEGQVIKQFFAFDKSLRNGANISAGDVDGNGSIEIVVGAGKNYKPEVRIFTVEGRLVNKFLAYHESFKGGVSVGVGDLNNDNISEIITGPASGGGPHVRIFNYEGKFKGEFFAYDKKLRMGLNITTADLDENGSTEILIAPQSGFKPMIKIFRATDFILQKEFLAYAPSFLGGVNLTVGDIDGDESFEIITGPGAGGGPHIRIFDPSGKLKGEFFAYSQNYRGGVRVGL